MPSRLTLNVFSPLPPLPTEIANHTAFLLPELGKLANVHVWTAQESWSVPAIESVEVRRFAPTALPIRDLNRAEATFYNIGNNATFHRAIFNVASRVPGLVILHDTRLQHFFARFAETDGPDREFYLETMRRHHGDDAVVAAKQFLAGTRPLQELVENYPLTLAAASNAIGIVLHNAHERAALQKHTRLPAYFVPLSSRLGPPVPRTPRGDGLVRLIMFGFLGDNRRLAGILEALREVPNREAYRLDIYGHAGDPAAMASLLEGAGLQEQVKAHGYVNESVLDRALAEADLALNLRYPSMGEASASQLRIWGAELPALVTRTGWYEQLPADCVFFVDPAREVEDIIGHLQALRLDPCRYISAGRRGRAELEQHHTPAAYAAALVRIAEDAPAQHARRQAIELVRASTRELLSLTKNDMADRLVPTLSRAIGDVLTPSEPI